MLKIKRKGVYEPQEFETDVYFEDDPEKVRQFMNSTKIYENKLKNESIFNLLIKFWKFYENYPDIPEKFIDITQTLKQNSKVIYYYPKSNDEDEGQISTEKSNEYLLDENAKKQKNSKKDEKKNDDYFIKKNRLFNMVDPFDKQHNPSKIFKQETYDLILNKFNEAPLYLINQEFNYLFGA